MIECCDKIQIFDSQKNLLSVSCRLLPRTKLEFETFPIFYRVHLQVIDKHWNRMVNIHCINKITRSF